MSDGTFRTAHGGQDGITPRPAPAPRPRPDPTGSTSCAGSRGPASRRLRRSGSAWPSSSSTAGRRRPTSPATAPDRFAAGRPLVARPSVRRALALTGRGRREPSAVDFAPMGDIRILDVTDVATFGRIPPCADPGFDHRSCDYWEDDDRGSKAARLSWLESSAARPTARTRRARPRPAEPVPRRSRGEGAGGQPVRDRPPGQPVPDARRGRRRPDRQPVRAATASSGRRSGPTRRASSSCSVVASGSPGATPRSCSRTTSRRPTRSSGR